MNDVTTVTKNVRSILEKQFLAVLATQGEEQPHASLVGFVVTENLQTIV